MGDVGWDVRLPGTKSTLSAVRSDSRVGRVRVSAFSGVDEEEEATVARG